MESEIWRGKRVVVTGATSGLGLALTEALVARSAKVGAVARGRERVLALEAKHPAAVVGVVGDVGTKEDIHPIAMQLMGRLGGVDVLVHNASSLGTADGGRGPLRGWADTECEDLEAALATNVLGPHRLTRALLGPLLESRGVVVTISSDAAVSAYPGWGAYSASKAALLHATKIWSAEMGERLRFLSFDPGDMDTPMHAQALPDADPATLKRPATSAGELLALVSPLLLGAR
jgi:NAD(P)-dependent dehydrogenase (short-subunit alcohol dehydrogenase family)